MNIKHIKNAISLLSLVTGLIWAVAFTFAFLGEVWQAFLIANFGSYFLGVTLTLEFSKSYLKEVQK